MTAVNRTNVSYTLFWIFPLAALVSALRNFKVPKSKNIVWLFIVFYGFTFVFSSKELDSDRYVKDLKVFHQSQVSDLSGFGKLLYSTETNYVDVLQPFITFLVSRFTDNGRILFAVFGVVFGFFYTRNLWFLFSVVKSRLRREAIPFLVLFAFVIAIWQINGFRFWTAAHVFIYGFFLWLQGRKVRGGTFCVISVFVHFSFIFLVLIMSLYVLVGNRLVWLFLIYISSFLVTQLSLDVFKPVSDAMPAAFQERSDRYTSDVYLKALNKTRKERPGNWYVRGRIVALSYCLNILLTFLMVWHRKTLKDNRFVLQSLSFGLLMASTLNLISALPSSGRFYFVFYMLVLAALFVLVQTVDKPVIPQWLMVPALLITIFYVTVEIRVGFDTTGIFTIVGNPMIAPFVEHDTALISYIK